MPHIIFNDVWEMYRIKFTINHKASWEDFWALKDISFSIREKDTVGIIGENGAGKSTILRLIAGMLKPDRGKMSVSGRVSGLLELGAGFQPELTGDENIFLNTSLFGLTRAQTEKRYEGIIHFASLGKFINAPVNCYSQGMFVRLAFAIAVHVDPDILLIDDTLAVGDEHYQRKCIKKIFELKDQGKIIVVVSHDVNMLCRLCKRTLFLKEGTLVKDDFTQKVVPLYAQVLGQKESVGILTRGPLTLVFNSGRMFLNWHDQLLTPQSGGHAVFLISRKWYYSMQAEWDVKKEGEDTLVAYGIFYQLSLKLFFRLKLLENLEVVLDIQIETGDSVEIEESFFNIMLSGEYGYWFSEHDKGAFPAIEERDKNWAPLLETAIGLKSIGVKAQETSHGKIPSVAFEQANPSFRSRSQILNSDYLSHCRVLEHKICGGMQDLLAAGLNRVICFSGKIITDIPDTDDYLERIQDEYTLSYGKLKLLFCQGELVISFDSVLLTKSGNIRSMILSDNRWFSSNQADWSVKKESKEKLILKGSWRNLPLVQVWEIEAKSEQSFLLHVTTQVTARVNIEEQNIKFCFSPEYSHWHTDYSSGKFPDSFQESDVDMSQRCIPGGKIEFISSDKDYLPLTFKFSDCDNNFAKIFNSSFYSKSRFLLLQKISPEKATTLSTEAQQSFCIQIALGGEIRALTVKKKEELTHGNLHFIFDSGRGRIFLKGKELTKKLGLYTALRFQGRWHNSMSSDVWKTGESQRDGVIRATGRWLHLPIRQDWEMRMCSNGSIKVYISMTVEKEVLLERLQTNLMLSERLTQWCSEGKQGFFPEFKKDMDDDWDCIWSEEKDLGFIGATGMLVDNERTVVVKFSPLGIDSRGSLAIVNSDIYHRARVLQLRDKENITFSPGTFVLFDGSILIEKK